MEIQHGQQGAAAWEQQVGHSTNRSMGTSVAPEWDGQMGSGDQLREEDRGLKSLLDSQGSSENSGAVF